MCIQVMWCGCTVHRFYPFLLCSSSPSACLCPSVHPTVCAPHLLAVSRSLICVSKSETQNQNKSWLVSFGRSAIRLNVVWETFTSAETLNNTAIFSWRIIKLCRSSLIRFHLTERECMLCVIAFSGLWFSCIIPRLRRD